MLERACTDLSLPQYRLLAMVAEGDERATALAGRLALAKPTITAAVDGLVERDLVTRFVVEGDRRAVGIRITPAGQQALAATEQAMTERMQNLLDRCADPDAVVAGIDQLRGALDAAMAERTTSDRSGAGAGAR
jgi:DNA-binding MarR family transcriptional regulator